jgi:hypothetical protein
MVDLEKGIAVRVDVIRLTGANRVLAAPSTTEQYGLDCGRGAYGLVASSARGAIVVATYLGSLYRPAETQIRLQRVRPLRRRCESAFRLAQADFLQQIAGEAAVEKMAVECLDSLYPRRSGGREEFICPGGEAAERVLLVEPGDRFAVR